MTAPLHSAGVPPESLRREGSKAHKAQQRHLDDELRARLKPGDTFEPAPDFGPGHVFSADAELQTQHGPVRCSMDAASSDGSGGHHWCYMRFTGTPDPDLIRMVGGNPHSHKCNFYAPTWAGLLAELDKRLTLYGHGKPAKS